eukprot:m51a1_g10327 hypothetical protein (280) ;mRNA; r:78680-79519
MSSPANSSRVVVVHGARGRRSYSAVDDALTIVDTSSSSPWVVDSAGDFDGDGAPDALVLPRPWRRAYVVALRQRDAARARVVLRLLGPARNVTAAVDSLRRDARVAVDLVSSEPQGDSTLVVVVVDAGDLVKLTDDVLVKINAVVVVLPADAASSVAVAASSSSSPAPVRPGSGGPDGRRAAIVAGVCVGCALAAVAAVSVAVAALVLARTRARRACGARGSKEGPGAAPAPATAAVAGAVGAGAEVPQQVPDSWLLSERSSSRLVPSSWLDSDPVASK